MKRFVFITVLLFATTVGAQSIPSWMESDFVGTAGPIEIQAELLDYHFPWSLPNPYGHSIMYGSISFFDDTGAQLTIDTVAKMRCGSEFGCYAFDPLPLNIMVAVPWDYSWQSYIGFTDHVNPFFDCIIVDLDIPTGLWVSGTMVFDGTSWRIHETMPYTVYSIDPVTVPLLPYIPRPVPEEVR